MATRRPPVRERAPDEDGPPPTSGGPPPEDRPSGSDGPHRRWPRYLAMGAGAILFGFLCGFALRDAGPQISTVGPPPRAFLNQAATDQLLFRIHSDLPGLMDTATLDYDGGDVRADAYVGDGTLTFRPADLSEGTHTLSFSESQPFVPWPVRRSWTFTVDHTKPTITLDRQRPAVRDAPVTLSGRVSEPARVSIDDVPVAVSGSGRFSYTFPEPPASAVTVRATDRAGNVRGVRTAIPVVPREPIAPIRGVHMTAISWATPSLRGPVLAMLKSGEINAIELDLKDESGIVGYDSHLPFAKEIGAVQPEYQLEKTVAEIHRFGGRVIGRVVAFRDPVYATWAWEHGRRDEVIQSPDGGEYKGYGGFTNFANPAVRKYNMDIAVEAGERGVDDILYDYIRRPDGPLDSMVFPGLRGGAQRSIVDFLGEVRDRLVPTDTFLGASLFGIAAFDPAEVAQDVRGIARNVDYVAPLIYPSHWGPGTFGLPDPESAPRATIEDSVKMFQEQVKGSGARVVPWLQDFSLRVPYGRTEVCAQLAGARAAGVREFIMWDANVTYTTASCLKG
jgi:hypothetical protein